MGACQFQDSSRRSRITVDVSSILLPVRSKLKNSSTCVKSFTFRPDSAATRSAPSSGRSSLTSTASTPPAPTMATATCSWSASMCTTMKPQEANMCPVQSLWTLSLVPWTVSAQDLLDRSSDQTTLCLDNLVLETTGLRVITQRVLSWWTQCLMSSERKLKAATASRDSSSPTPLVVELALAWAPSSSQKSVRSTLTES